MANFSSRRHLLLKTMTKTKGKSYQESLNWHDLVAAQNHAEVMVASLTANVCTIHCAASGYFSYE